MAQTGQDEVENLMVMLHYARKPRSFIVAVMEKHSKAINSGLWPYRSPLHTIRFKSSKQVGLNPYSWSLLVIGGAVA